MIAADNPHIIITGMTENHLENVFNLARGSKLSFWSYDDFKSEIGRDDSICLVAESHQREVVKVAAFLTARLIMEEGCAELYNIAVQDTFKRKEIGKRLLEYLIKSCVVSNLNYILLDVRESNRPAIALYAKLGFRVLAIRKNFYNLPAENSLTMIRQLKN